ncbi:MAG: DUF2877 domain-containing protein [Anaerolineae bacterium]|nr:DUF2877 domain-containing protein [Anaerolineae bacterium]
MTAQVAARSISRQAKTWLDEGQSIVQTLSVFRSACNLVTDGGEIVALVTPEVGDGPLNVVLEETADLNAIDGGAHVTSAPERITIGRLEIDLESAAVWEPCPDWQVLRARCVSCLPLGSCSRPACIDYLYQICARHARHSVFAPLLDGCTTDSSRPARSARPARSESALEAATLDRARKARVDLCAGWQGDRRRLRAGATALAGLGGGLTPAGDDFLVGAMLWAWLAHPEPGAFCCTLAGMAAPLTTALSAAFLRAAAGGQCSAAWQSLLAAVAGPRSGGDAQTREVRLAQAAHRILACGASSGADALLGFLCLAGCRTWYSPPEGGTGEYPIDDQEQRIPRLGQADGNGP